MVERLLPRKGYYSRQQDLIWVGSELPGAAWLRERHQARELAMPVPVVWRNFEASLDVDSLEPRTRAMST